MSGLRPWEWAAMDAHDYYRILEIRHAWSAGIADEKAARDERTKRQQGKAG